MPLQRTILGRHDMKMHRTPTQYIPTNQTRDNPCR